MHTWNCLCVLLKIFDQWKKSFGGISYCKINFHMWGNMSFAKCLDPNHLLCNDFYLMTNRGSKKGIFIFCQIYFFKSQMFKCPQIKAICFILFSIYTYKFNNIDFKNNIFIFFLKFIFLYWLPMLHNVYVCFIKGIDKSQGQWWYS